MPLYIKTNGEPVDKVIIEHTWFIIPDYKSEKPNKAEEKHVLVSSEIAEYIQHLESKIA